MLGGDERRAALPSARAAAGGRAERAGGAGETEFRALYKAQAILGEKNLGKDSIVGGGGGGALYYAGGGELRVCVEIMNSFRKEQRKRWGRRQRQIRPAHCNEAPTCNRTVRLRCVTDMICVKMCPCVQVVDNIDL